MIRLRDEMPAWRWPEPAGRYSDRNDRIGSTLAAHRAGM